MEPEPLTADIQRLQLCINDLISILALPAIWVGGEPSKIVQSLLDSLLGMLRLDLVYLRLTDPIGDAPVEVARLAQQGAATWSEKLGALLDPWLATDPQEWPPRLAAADGELSLLPLRLGLRGEIGLLVAGSRRDDFPRQTERLLLSVAANQATIGLQGARHLSEQKRLAGELDQRVMLRTAELAAINEELRREMSERQRVEEALRASEWNLRRMTETIPQMLWSATPDGAIDHCNGRLLDYTGFAAADVMGNSWRKLLHPDDIDHAVRTWRACVTTGEPYQVEVRIIHAADRTYRWCLTTARPLRDEEGRILKWHGACVDMHDWKRAQDELRDTQAELAHVTRVMTMGQLTASIAHELNQPLAGIITNASTCLRMLAADPPNVAGARETARRTIRDGNRASEVTKRLRTLFSKRHTAIEAVDLNAATREVIALASTELQRNSITLRVVLADDLPFVTGDRVQLQQVILNLILNGAEAMNGVENRPRKMVISTESERPGHVRVAVRDAGSGFDPSAIEKLFNPFYTTKSDGMGIGLSVCRSIVEHHQGRLWAEANDGPGSTFLFSVPCRPGGETGGSGAARVEASTEVRVGWIP